jgi:putative restriction endonuclease
MQFWWVNHKQTFAAEIAGQYIWCPKRKQNGAQNHFYETLREVQRGDLVFSFANAHLQGVGLAKLPCYSCPRPDEFGRVGQAWNDRGWRVDVGFRRFERPLRITAVASQIAPLLPSKYSPIQPNGHGNQGAYLASIHSSLARRLLELAEPALLALLDTDVLNEASSLIADPQPLTEWEEQLQQRIVSSDSIPETTRTALILARRGQGQFKQNVARFEARCRLTGVTNPTHLVASHIKPWRESDNAERLTGTNGLLLTPSIDHLFDRGFISFDDDGVALVSPVADPESLPRMGVTLDRRLFTGTFEPEQRKFLEYHRREIFLKSAA